MSESPSVVISLKSYKRLLKAEERLEMLEIGGVDNWDWYGESLRGIDEIEEEIDNKTFEDLIVQNCQTCAKLK